MGHVQSCFCYWSSEAEPVPPLVRPRPGEYCCRFDSGLFVSTVIHNRALSFVMLALPAARVADKNNVKLAWIICRWYILCWLGTRYTAALETEVRSHHFVSALVVILDEIRPGFCASTRPNWQAETPHNVLDLSVLFFIRPNVFVRSMLPNLWTQYFEKNLAIANRSRVSCACNTSRASIVTP